MRDRYYGFPYYKYVPGGNRRPLFLTEQTAQQGNQGDAPQSDTAASHELFHTQIGVGKRLDGGRRRVKKYLWSF